MKSKETCSFDGIFLSRQFYWSGALIRHFHEEIVPFKHLLDAKSLFMSCQRSTFKDVSKLLGAKSHHNLSHKQTEFTIFKKKNCQYIYYIFFWFFSGGDSWSFREL